MAELSKELRELAENAIRDENLPNIYFNGFVHGSSQGDIFVILQRNNKPVAVVNASFTVAKTLSKHLANAIAALEDSTGNTIMTTEDVLAKQKVKG